MLQVCLGLEPQAFDHRLVIRRPLLPNFVEQVDLLRLQVGRGQAHLRFTRQAGARARVDVVSVSGGLDVVVEQEVAP
jgi:hypothetical protein